MSLHENLAGEDMDLVNEFNERIRQREEIMLQAFRMVDPSDGIGNMYLPTTEHIKVLVNEIKGLREQLKLKEIFESQAKNFE